MVRTSQKDSDSNRYELYVIDIRDLSSEERFQELSHYAGKDRMEKLTRINNPAERARSLGAGLLLSFAMKKYGIDMTDERFRVKSGKYGKPFITSSLVEKEAGCADIPEFSLSHSGDIALCAISKNAIGADIQIRDRKLSDAFIHRCFNEYETASGISLLDIWCAKESFLKAEGIGLAGDPGKISIIFSGRSDITDGTMSKDDKVQCCIGQNLNGTPILYDGADSGYKCRLFTDFIPGYAMSICVPDDPDFHGLSSIKPEMITMDILRSMFF